MIDTHCHLHYDYAPKSLDQVVGEAARAGVKQLMTVGVDFESLPSVVKISEAYDGVFHSVGVHPHDGKFVVSEKEIQHLREAAQHDRCLAIGEIGLDYYYEHSDRAAQILALELQLELARELALPVIIHSRDGERDLLPRLLQHAQRCSPSLPSPGVIHCFTGTLEFAQACVEAGFLISFSGILTFKNSEQLRGHAKQLPLSHVMVETDAPYLAPVPFRGKKM